MNLFVSALVLVGLNISSVSFACYNDYSCGYGRRCVKPAGSYSYEGTCVTIVDSYGNRDYDADRNWGRSTQPREVDGCQFNTDCEIGFKCLKEAGQMYGLCFKK